MTEEQTVDVAAPRKKRAVNSKRKGGNFEQHIAKTLEQHLAPMKFRRSQSSGAILGGKNAVNLEHYSEGAKALFIGDVVPTNEADVIRDIGWKLRFALECKFYKTAPNLEHLLYNTGIRGWFEQAVGDAAKINKEPLLIFKFNHTEMFCAVNEHLAMPATATKHMILSYTDDLPCPRTFRIIYLKEALLDLPWWKVSTEKVS